ncbi:MAG: choice-of-anchor Q domain-containing protein [Deltaproteobacteria bacterium]|nr:choice-of-anchor Q domain-containing protein [Deltaproteobacteria bacterium]
MHRWNAAVIAVGLVLFGSGAMALPMQTFTVSNLNDTGMGSLRQAVADANASAGYDAVVFAAGVTGTIQLTSGAIAITETVEILGPGARLLTVDSNERIFTLSSAGPRQDVFIGYLTLAGGTAPLFGNGGAILSSGQNLLMEGVTLSGNSAPSGEGGAISVTGANLSIVDSTIAGNTAQKAAGLHVVAGDLFLLQGTVSGNQASDSVGGIKLEFSTGGLYNSTIADNQAMFSQGGVLNNQGGAVRLRSTIVAGNRDGAGGSDLVRFGDSSTYNVEESLIQTPPAPNTINGTDDANLVGVDPQLAALADNGGPTDTQALPYFSPAIDRGFSLEVNTYDQRQAPFRRVVRDGTDIGAYELQSFPGAAPTLAPLALAALCALLLLAGCATLRGFGSGT